MMNVYTFLISLVLAFSCHAAAISTMSTDSNDATFTATAIVTNSETNNSVIQCWKFLTPLSKLESGDAAGALTLSFTFSSLGSQYTVTPPRFDAGVQNAPAQQFVYIASGKVRFTLPHSTGYDDQAWIMGGSNGLIVIGDMMGSGHKEQYPSDEPTISLQLPFLNDIAPNHNVLHSGPCNKTYNQSQLTSD
ncbi:uncharacterized protein K452DRAFT_273009 [Aplosporella prunicola CBS 121167]|uniref:DOMON domain-containing protein n=1 Tax=Aplosporella prunicola CBS 121167 TaxID=1176127 RepID=A0A6A6BC23_9PEZI|nr:uncharacterized protein K452DRAFT_273009 [Aplosporella prunicola CBS 121167]KAF2140457.1 hypothetical protein K452DRAFT_273009 [Aplosporella prunicola CBS 121167]